MTAVPEVLSLEDVLGELWGGDPDQVHHNQHTQTQTKPLSAQCRTVKSTINKSTQTKPLSAQCRAVESISNKYTQTKPLSAQLRAVQSTVNKMSTSQSCKST